MALAIDDLWGEVLLSAHKGVGTRIWLCHQQICGGVLGALHAEMPYASALVRHKTDVNWVNDTMQDILAIHSAICCRSGSRRYREAEAGLAGWILYMLVWHAARSGPFMCHPKTLCCAFWTLTTWIAPSNANGSLAVCSVHCVYHALTCTSFTDALT